MNNRKLRLAAVPVALIASALLIGVVAKPVWAQVRAALVRDTDNPALAPFSGQVSFSFSALNTQALLTTVPAGKRLVIEHVSFVSGGQSSSQLVYASLRSAQFGTVVLVLPITAPHASVTPGLTLQDGSLPVKAYFDAGQDVWVSASYTGGTRDLTMYLSGYYVTP
jgi:hypothetical protein